MRYYRRTYNFIGIIFYLCGFSIYRNLILIILLSNVKNGIYSFRKIIKVRCSGKLCNFILEIEVRGILGRFGLYEIF